MIERLSAEDFEPFKGQPLDLELPSGERLPLTLAEISPLSEATRASQHRAPFRLILVDPGFRVAPQRTYPLHHPTQGPIELFIVPIGPDPTGMRYEVIFT